jgi:thiol:disulfide interchange protein DsbG
MKDLKALFALLLGLFASPTLTTAADFDYPEPVQALIARGTEIAGRFAAPGGMTGYVGRQAGEAVAMYLTPDGEHVIVGRMLDIFGQDVTEQHFEQYLPPSDLDGLWLQLGQADWIAEGSAKPNQIVYVFSDPNCPYCHALWQSARPYLERGIQLRHIVVGVMHSSSRKKAAQIYAAADPVAALRPPLRWSAEDESRSLPEIPAEIHQLVERNNRLMQRLAVQVTPTLFYRDASGRVRMLVGLPDETALAEEVFRRPPLPTGR